MDVPDNEVFDEKNLSPLRSAYLKINRTPAKSQGHRHGW